MRLLIDLDTDAAGRPVGKMWSEPTGDCNFADWLDLLRLLERCIERPPPDHSGVVAHLAIGS
jgi:hypothetical protein